MRSNTFFTAYHQIDLKDSTFKIKDGTSPTPNEVSIKIGEGTLTFTERKNMDYTLDRGTLDEVREGDEVPMDVKFDFVWEYIKANTSSGGTPTIEDALKQIGNAATWVSSDADTCRPYAVDLEVLNEPTPAACGDKETITLPDFRYEQIDHDPRTGQISVTGKCNAKIATVVRATQ
jgi:hypothetical protein